MSSLNKEFNVKLNQATTKLVDSLTTFKEGSINHTFCLEYAVNNFYYHRYLDPNSNKLADTIQGICDKFYIHSQPVKAKALMKNYNAFMNNTLLDCIYQQSQSHYKMISILLQLSVTPLQKDYELSVKPDKQAAKDTFDWGAYLLDGEERFDPEDWSLSSDDELEDGLQITSTPDNLSPVKPKAVNNKANGRFNNHSLHLLTDSSEFSIYPQYWHDRLTDYDHMKSLNQAFKFETGKQSSGEIKEINVCREVIWLLCGHRNLFVFVEKDGRLQVSNDFALSHITNSGLAYMMADFTECGNAVRKLKSFACQTQSTMTYQAFATSLSKYLKQMQMDLYKEEQRLMELSEIYLITDLKKKLSNHLNLVDLLGKIFDASIAVDKNTDSNAIKTSRLLSVLYHSLLDENNLVLDQASCQPQIGCELLFHIFMDTIRPYIDIMDGWVSDGELLDFNEEFVIGLCSKPDNQSVQSDRFWHDAVKLNVPDVNESLPWLSALLNKIIVGGKSTEILQTMNVVTKRQKKNVEMLAENERKFVIYERFRDLIYGGINAKVGKSSTHVKNLPTQTKSEKNILLRSNFANLFATNVSKPTENLLPIENLNFEKNSTVSHIVYSTLNSLLDLKCEKTNRQLLYAFKNQFNLTQTLDVFCNLYLMGQGDVMHYFCVEIFEQLASHDVIKLDQIGLNVLLQDSMGQFTKPVDVVVSNIATPGQALKSEFNNLNMTDTIQLHYTVKWPLDLVFTDRCIAVYKQAFTYLVKLKRAIHAVETLKFSDLGSVAQYSKKYPENDSSKLEKWNCMLSLRCNILHLLKHWHIFIMVSVIQTEKQKLVESIANAKSLDDILKGHEEFLNQIFIKCMFSSTDKVSKLVQGTVTKIMKLTLWFGKVWGRGIDNISIKPLKDAESSFNESRDFLMSILKPISARGAFPLLNALAVAFLK